MFSTTHNGHAPGQVTPESDKGVVTGQGNNPQNTTNNDTDSRSHGPIQQAPDAKAIAESQDLALTTIKTEARIDSRLLARQLGIQPESAFKLLKDYRANFEDFGKVRFEIGASPGSRTGQKEKFALLNEDQSFLLLTYSRNTARVRGLKVKLVKAFGMARRAADLRRTEYLPQYHLLHDRLGMLAAGSPNERHVHMNVNRLLNKFAGIEAGQRASAALPHQAMLIVGQLVASNAAQGATNHHDGYQRIKANLQALGAVAQLEMAT